MASLPLCSSRLHPTPGHWEPLCRVSTVGGPSSSTQRLDRDPALHLPGRQAPRDGSSYHLTVRSLGFTTNEVHAPSTLTHTAQKARVTRLCVCSVASDSAIPRTAARQPPLSMGFSRREYWSGLPFPSPGDLLNPGTEPAFLTSLALAGRFFTTTAAWVSELLGSRRGFTHCS